MRTWLIFDLPHPTPYSQQVWTTHLNTCNSPAYQDAEEAPDLGG